MKKVRKSAPLHLNRLNLYISSPHDNWIKQQAMQYGLKRGQYIKMLIAEDMQRRERHQEDCLCTNCLKARPESD